MALTKLTNKIISDLAAGYTAGKTCVELADEFNLAPATVCRGLRKAGIDPERKDNFFVVRDLPINEHEEILTHFKNGASITKLARQFNTSYEKIAELLELNGLHQKKESKNPSSKVIQIGNNIRRILNNEEQLQLCEQFVESPLTRQELANEWGIHKDTVNAILRRHDTEIKKYVPEEIVDIFCQEFKDKIRNLYEIAKMYTLSPPVVKYWLTKRGVLATKEEEARQATTKRLLTAAEFKRIAREHEVQALQNIIDITEDPTIEARTRFNCNQYIIEISRGKPGEMAADDDDEKKTAADKILGLVNSDLFKKKG